MTCERRRSVTCRIALSCVTGGFSVYHAAAVRISYSRVKGTSWQVNTDKQEEVSMTSFVVLLCPCEEVKQNTVLFLAEKTYNVNVDISCQCRRLVMFMMLHPVVWNAQHGLMLQYTDLCKYAHFDE